MKDNFIYIGVFEITAGCEFFPYNTHFNTSYNVLLVYVNALLATLNARDRLRSIRHDIILINNSLESHVRVHSGDLDEVRIRSYASSPLEKLTSYHRRRHQTFHCQRTSILVPCKAKR